MGKMSQSQELIQYLYQEVMLQQKWYVALFHEVKFEVMAQAVSGVNAHRFTFVNKTILIIALANHVQLFQTHGFKRTERMIT